MTASSRRANVINLSAMCLEPFQLRVWSRGVHALMLLRARLPPPRIPPRSIDRAGTHIIDLIGDARLTVRPAASQPASAPPRTC